MSTGARPKSTTSRDITDGVAKLHPDNALVRKLDVRDQSSISDSGEVFNHSVWRPIFMLLWLFTTRERLFGLMHNVLHRAKAIKATYAGQAFNVDFTLKTKEECPDRLKYSNIMDPDKDLFVLTICCPTAAQNVEADMLTLERVKCAARSVIAPQLLIEGRFSASAETCGLGNMIRSFKNFYINLKDELEARQEWNDTDKADHKIWNDFYHFWDGKDESEKISPLAMAAASMSTKEVYMEDELAIPGTLWWTSIHATMLDISNKFRSVTAAPDKRALLENSNFFSDFKRKMGARGLGDQLQGTYDTFYTKMGKIINMFTLSHSLMSPTEASVMDEIMKSYNEVKKEVRLSGKVEAAKVQVTKQEYVLGGDLDEQIKSNFAKQLSKYEDVYKGAEKEKKQAATKEAGE